MNKYVVKTDDKIVQKVIEKIDQRSLIGQAKYGAMMMEEVEGKDKDLNDFLIDVQEEIMDALFKIAFEEDKAILEAIQVEVEKPKSRLPVRLAIDKGSNVYRRRIDRLVKSELLQVAE